MYILFMEQRFIDDLDGVGAASKGPFPPFHSVKSLSKEANFCYRYLENATDF